MLSGAHICKEKHMATTARNGKAAKAVRDVEFWKDMAVKASAPGRHAKTRQQLLAWWSRTMNEMHWVEDMLGRDSGAFADALTPEQRNELSAKLDSAWHQMALVYPLHAPDEFPGE
jgi:hypothetical protein